MFRILFCFVITLLFAEEHQFAGKHFLGSYLECDVDALSNVDAVRHALDAAVQASGASILDSSSFVFSPNGLTSVYLLSESHASLHTYPEYGACFVDLFTCGDHCSAERFDQVLRAYLQPKKVNVRTFIRNEGVEEVFCE